MFYSHLCSTTITQLQSVFDSLITLKESRKSASLVNVVKVPMIIGEIPLYWEMLRVELYSEFSGGRSFATTIMKCLSKCA